MKAREMQEQLGRSHDSHMMQQQQLSASLPSGGLLRSAGLRPLGVVDAPAIRADNCLGIVSSKYAFSNRSFLFFWRDIINCLVISLVVATERHEPRSRPRSSTVPGMTLDFPTRLSKGVRTRGRATESQTRNRRTFSAVSAYSLDSDRVLHTSAALPKNFALVPKNNHQKQTSAERERTKQLVSPPEQKGFPPASLSSEAAEGEMKIDVKGLRKSEQGGVHASPTHSREQESRENSPSSKSPHFSSHSPPSRFSETEPISEASDKAVQFDDSGGKRDGGKQISVVSLGEVATAAEDQQRLKNQKRKHRSGSREGKLSLGWSATKPLEPVAGHSVYQNGVKPRQEKGEGSELKECKDTSNSKASSIHAGEAAVSKDYIHINVNKCLESEQVDST